MVVFDVLLDLPLVFRAPSFYARAFGARGSRPGPVPT